MRNEKELKDLDESDAKSPVFSGNDLRNFWENSENVDEIIDYVSETLKKKLAHETTIKLKELYPNLDEDKIEKLNKLFKEN